LREISADDYNAGLVQPFSLALRFLTTVPFPWSTASTPPAQHFGRAVALFPLIGLLLGIAVLPLDWLARALWSPLVASALVLGALIILSGALHLDGFLDTCDGLFLWRPERRLEVMRDSRVGGFAVAGGLALYGIKLAALGNAAGDARLACLLLVPVFGRLAVSLVLITFPYARSSGLGSAFKDASRRIHLAVAGLIAVVPASIFGLPGLVGLLAAGGLALLLGRYITRRLGGLTGDTYGFILECAETCALLVLSAPPLWAAGLRWQ
jgi:adenosylcobinamide-GDP ribazoletransferase